MLLKGCLNWQVQRPRWVGIWVEELLSWSDILGLRQMKSPSVFTTIQQQSSLLWNTAVVEWAKNTPTIVLVLIKSKSITSNTPLSKKEFLTNIIKMEAATRQKFMPKPLFIRQLIKFLDCTTQGRMLVMLCRALLLQSRWVWPNNNWTPPLEFTRLVQKKWLIWKWQKSQVFLLKRLLADPEWKTGGEKSESWDWWGFYMKYLLSVETEVSSVTFQLLPVILIMLSIYQFHHT